jgi:hypothetical protein
MTFRETLEKHLRTIRERDLPALIETLPDETLTLITSDGQLIHTVAEFVARHRNWFDQPSWTLETEIVDVFNSPELALAVIRLDYRDEQTGMPPLHETSVLTLAFALRQSRWVMVLDQNTPVRATC